MKHKNSILICQVENRLKINNLQIVCNESKNVNEFIFKIQQEWSTGHLYKQLMKWANNKANKERFKYTGWFGIAGKYYEENRNKNKGNRKKLNKVVIKGK